MCFIHSYWVTRKELDEILNILFISAEAANRASIMGAAFLKPDNLQGNHGGAGAGGRRGSDPRRTTALEQQHLANVAADKRPGKL